MSVIELADVRLDHPRGGPPLVTGASFAVGAGEIVVIVGAAGAGTSRFLAALLGEPVAAGQVSVLGRDVGKLRRSSLRMLRRNVGIVPQDLLLLDDRSAQLNVVMPLEIDGIPRSVSVMRAAEILAQLGLASEAALPIDCLAASARQRVAVARALVREPDLLLADQPTSMQDAAGCELVCDAFTAAAARGAACLVLSRDPALRAIAELRGWRQLWLIDGVLDRAGEKYAQIDDVIVELESNIVPFPRAAGA